MGSKIVITHVGNMNNKGTQALLCSDVSCLKELLKDDSSISVSTTDIEGVKRLGLPLNDVFSTLVDIPYERADSLAKKLGVSRSSVTYRVLALGALILMFFQTILTLVSIWLMELGLKGIYRNDVLRRIRSGNLVLSCSDENFKETASLLPLNIYWILTWWSMLFERTVEVMVARSFGRPVVMLPNSVGPFRTWVGRSLSGIALSSCSSIIVRDPISFEIVRSMGVKPRRFLTSDMALLFRPEARTVREIAGRPLIGVCAGVYSFSISMQQIKRYVVEHAEALDSVIEKYGFHVVFLPHYISGFAYDDFEISKLVLQNMRNKEHARILKIDDLGEFKLTLNQLDVLVSSKMHPAVLAVSGYVPSIAVVYDHKQTGFFKDLGMLDYTVRLQEASSKELVARIDKAWSQRERTRRMLSVRVPVLQEKIRKTVRTAIEPFVECK